MEDRRWKSSLRYRSFGLLSMWFYERVVPTYVTQKKVNVR